MVKLFAPALSQDHFIFESQKRIVAIKPYKYEKNKIKNARKRIKMEKKNWEMRKFTYTCRKQRRYGRSMIVYRILICTRRPEKKSRRDFLPSDLFTRLFFFSFSTLISVLFLLLGFFFFLFHNTILAIG